MIIPYFIYNLLYSLITVVIFKKYNILLGELPTLYNFFITPFLNGHQYHLFLSAWFVIYLFILQITFILGYKFLKKFISNIHIQLFIFTIIGLMGTILPLKIPLIGFNLLFVKILFGMFFLFLGVYYKNIVEKKSIFNIKGFIVAIIIQIILSNKYGDIGYYLAWADYSGRIFTPFITSIIGIYCIIFISKLVSNAIDNNDILIKIGENSFHIMVNHLLVFFLMNLFLVYKESLDINNLSSVWFKYKPEEYWWIYSVLGIIVPTYIAIALNRIKLYMNNLAKIKKLNIKFKTYNVGD